MKRLIFLLPLTFSACSTNLIQDNTNEKTYKSQEEIKALSRNYESELNKYNISELHITISDSLTMDHKNEIINVFKNSNLFNIRNQELNYKLNQFQTTNQLSLTYLSNKDLNLFIKKIETINNKRNFVTNTTYREFNNMIEMDKDILIDNYIIDLNISRQ